MAEETYVETCRELIGSSVGMVDDAVTDLHNALYTEHTFPGAWSSVVQAAHELALRAEDLAREAAARRSR